MRNHRWMWVSLLTVGLLWPVGCSKAGAGGSDRPSFSTRSEYHELRVERVARGLSHPWGVAFLPGGEFLITERSGGMFRIREGRKQAVSGVPEVSARGQGGLLDVVLHPDFEEDPWVYWSWSKAGTRGTATAVSRGRLRGLVLEDVEEVFVQDRFSRAGRHYGSRLAFLPDGTLLISIGDRGSEPPRAQDLMDHAGTIVRIHADGSVPDDNPLVGRDDALPEIWSWGHRNIQGMVVEPGSSTVWVTEHGPRGGDILHRVRPGENHGWPVVTQGLDYGTQEPIRQARGRSMEGVVDPVYHFGPTLAPSGLAWVPEGRFTRWQDNLLAGGLRGQRIRRLVMRDGEVVHDEELLLQEVGRIRDVRLGPDGHVYLLTDADRGALYRITLE